MGGYTVSGVGVASPLAAKAVVLVVVVVEEEEEEEAVQVKMLAVDLCGSATSSRRR